jgi:hypothetical protein
MLLLYNSLIIFTVTKKRQEREEGRERMAIDYELDKEAYGSKFLWIHSILLDSMVNRWIK